MADYMTVTVYLRAEQTRKLREHGIEDVPRWIRSLVKDSIMGMVDPPESAPDLVAPSIDRAHSRGERSEASAEGNDAGSGADSFRPDFGKKLKR